MKVCAEIVDATQLKDEEIHRKMIMIRGLLLRKRMISGELALRDALESVFVK